MCEGFRGSDFGQPEAGLGSRDRQHDVEVHLGNPVLKLHGTRDYDIGNHPCKSLSTSTSTFFPVRFAIVEVISLNPA